MRKFVLAAVAALIVLATASAAVPEPVPVRTLDGSGNNVVHSNWGQANTQYLRVAPPNYADHVASMVSGPPARYVSNREFNDIGQNLFSENNITQWGWSWGQFMDHDFGLRDETPAERAPIAFDAHDPLEQFKNDFPPVDAMSFNRTPAAPGTGVTSPRQQINTISSFIDASNIYGVTDSRLEWLRTGPVNGDMSDNGADLLLTPDSYLPRADARGDAAAAPPMDLMGGLVATPTKAVVSGDVRANENIALTSLHTLFAREHNRIVAELPSYLSPETKFQIARRVVGAEMQYITYNAFLPALGVKLPTYRDYDPTVNASLSNEFAVVGYRAHSMIHGEFDVDAPAGTYSPAQLDAFRAQTIKVTEDGNVVTLTIPLNIAFGNPDLVQAVGLERILESLGEERQYKNDEQIDNSLRSVLFQVPKPGIPDPTVCGSPVVNPDCFTGVQDLGAIDIQRGRDHGMPLYNDLRRAYGLPPKPSFKSITGEATDSFPSDPAINPANPIDDPQILDFLELRDSDGNVIPLGTEEAQEDAVTGIRRTTIAARLKAIYGSVDNLDAFVGMVAEQHVPGAEFGDLQLAIWKKQFKALRDGDRFFYLNDPYLITISQQYGIDYRHTLAEIIAMNTGVTVQPDVFKLEPAPAGGTTVRINAGGGAVAASIGTFAADQSFTGGSTFSTTASISGTADPALYQNERWGLFSYAIPVENGVYDVRLHFVEMYFGSVVPGSCVGKRIFNMDIVETPASPDIANLDICAQVGPRVALVRTVHGVTVSNGVLDIKSINGAADDPELAAIEVVPADTTDTTPPTVSITAPATGDTVSGSTTVTATASDDVTVAGVQFMLDGSALGSEVTTAPFSVPWNTAGVANGSHTLRAVAHDAAGNTAVSSDVTVTVANAAPTVLLGDPQVEAFTDSNAPGLAEAVQTTAATSGTLQNLTLYVDAASAATRIVVGLYTDSGGHPGTVLAQGTLDGPAAGDWNTVAVPAVAVTAGTRYWVALLGTGGALGFRDRCCGGVGAGPTETSAETTLTTLPATWSTGTVYGDAPVAIYGTG
jgi:hypothetical protein